MSEYIRIKDLTRTKIRIIFAWKLDDYSNTFECSNSFHTHVRMSEYIHMNKFDMNKCQNIFVLENQYERISEYIFMTNIVEYLNIFITLWCNPYWKHGYPDADQLTLAQFQVGWKCALYPADHLVWAFIHTCTMCILVWAELNKGHYWPLSPPIHPLLLSTILTQVELQYQVAKMTHYNVWGSWSSFFLKMMVASVAL